MGDLRKAIKLANKMCAGTERYFRRAKKDAKEIAITIFEHIDRWRPKCRCFAPGNCFDLKEGPIKRIAVRYIEKRVEVNAVVDTPADFSHNIFIYEEIRVRAAQHNLDIKVILHTPNSKQVISYP